MNQVIQVYGEKKTEGKNYTSKDLVRLTSGDTESKEKFIGIINEKEDGSGYYMVVYYRTDIMTNVIIYYSNQNSSTRWHSAYLVLFLLLFIGLCIILGHYPSKRIKKPLNLLVSGMKRVKAGESDVFLDFRTEAEFAEIRDIFNVMANSLEAAKKDKEEAETKKNKMLLELSHDIRTPIATINSTALALEHDLVKDEEKQKYYKTIRQKVARVELLADDMFTMLKMKSSNYKIHKKKENISEFLRRQCAEYYQEAQERGLEMVIEVQDNPVWYDGDVSLLNRAVGNLIINAIKYNETGTVIAVCLLKTDDEITIQISDDGSPIPEAIREKLFDDFIRGDQARMSGGGTGLSLSIAKAIIEKHHGDIFYRRQEGKNQFVIVLY